MECLVPFLFLIIVFVTVSTIVTKSQSQTGRKNRAYQAIAERYGGQLHAGGLFRRPRVRFRYGETPCFLSSISAGRSGIFTQILIQWTDARFRLEVVPRWRMDQLWELKGMTPFKTMDAEFDEAYIVRTNDEDAASRFLSNGVKWQINQLRQMLDSDDVYIRINRGELMIKKPTFLKETKNVDDFVRFSVELFDQGMLTRYIGIDFVSDEQVQIVEEVICQVCGDEILTDMVFCIRCKTPHCKECWQYTGQCSTYGCGETRFTLPAVASPKDPKK